MTIKLFASAWLILSIAIFTGCGGKKGPEVPVGSLTGKVISKGKPISKCRVKLFNTKTFKPLMVTVKEDCSYEFERVPVGDYTLAVLTEPWHEASDPPPDNRIPMNYRDTKKSGLTTTVVQGANQYDIQIN